MPVAVIKLFMLTSRIHLNRKGMIISSINPAIIRQFIEQHKTRQEESNYEK